MAHRFFYFDFVENFHIFAFAKIITIMQDIDKEISICRQHAIDLRSRGYNCAQCVLMSLSGHLGIEEDFAARISAAYGTGFGGAGEMCGALSILGVAAGLMAGGSGPQDKSCAMKVARELFGKFAEINDGRFLCRDLKGKDPVKKCPDLIKEAVGLFIHAMPAEATSTDGFNRGGMALPSELSSPGKPVP